MIKNILLAALFTFSSGSFSLLNKTPFHEPQKQVNSVVLTNLVTNGDFTTPKPSPNENQALGFTYDNVTDITLSGGIAKFTGTQQFGLLAAPILSTDYIGNKLYVFSRYKSSSPEVRLTFGQGTTAYHSGDNNYNFISMINDITVSPRFLQVSDYRASGWTPIEVDYIGAINLTATFGAGNEPSKVQLDSIIESRGYFETTTIDFGELEYYNDYIDLYFFDNLLLEFYTAAGNSVNYFKITGYVDNDKLDSTGVYENDFKYFTPIFYQHNNGVSLSTQIENLQWEQYITLSNERLPVKVDQYGFALVTDYKTIDNIPNYTHLTNTWLDFQYADYSENGYKVTIFVPYGNLSTPPGDYQTTLMNMRFFNQKYYDQFVSGLDNVSSYMDGFDDGYNNGYKIGYNKGVVSDFNAWSWLTAIFTSMGALLNLQLLPGVTIGGIVTLILVLTLLPFLIKLLKGGGGDNG